MKSKTNKILSILLSLCMLISLMPASAVFAAEQAGDFTVYGGVLNTDYTYEDNTLTIKSSAPVTISGTTTKDKIVIDSICSGDNAANVTLDSANIDVESGNAIRINENATLNLTPVGENVLSPGGTMAGICVPQNTTLTIDGTGELLVYGGRAGSNGGAGIGANGGQNMGTVIINGGKIRTVSRSGGGSGIGLGGWGGSGGTIIINGGHITAIGNGGEGSFFGNSITIKGGVAETPNDTRLDSVKKENCVILQRGEGTVYGNAVFSQELTVSEGQPLIIPEGTTLSAAGNAKIVNNGTMVNNGSITGDVTNTGEGSLQINGTITGNVTNSGIGYILGTINGNVTNSGSLYLEGNVTGTITNTGTIYKLKNTVLPEETAGNVIICDETVWISVGDLKVKGGIFFRDYKYENNTVIVLRNSDLHICGTDKQTADRIVVNSDVTANITIENVDINTTNSAMEINGTCYLTVLGENKLASQKGTGVQLTGNSVFVITKESTGKLSASGGNTLAGIGSYGGKVIIEGGDITANGGSGGAGIGGYSGGGSGCDVTINGGTVTAYSYDASGIGAGWGDGSQGTFQTGKDVNTVIYASSIGDRSLEADWSGVIFIGNEGKVYGQNTVSQDIEISKGKKLTVPVEKSITFTDEYSLNNNDGTLVVDGTVNGNVNNSSIGYVFGEIDGNVQNEGTLYLSGKMTGNITNTGIIYKLKGASIPDNVGGTIIECGEWIPVGDLEVKGGQLLRDYKYENNILTVLQNSDLHIRGTGEQTADRIVINSDVSASITIENVNIAPYRAPALVVDGTCNLTIIGENILQGQANAGLGVPQHGTLVITAESTGKLTANGNGGGAGIGGAAERDAGKITINGGTVIANGGGNNSAGIGGGGAQAYGATPPGKGGTIVINGGTVIANEDGNGDGIGGGWWGWHPYYYGRGSFSTGENGHAVIYTTSIGDRSKEANWSGVIFTGNDGNVYGNPTISENINVSGKTLIVPAEKTLTLDDGTIKTDNGTIQIDGSVMGFGTIDALNGSALNGIDGKVGNNVALLCKVTKTAENLTITGEETASNQTDYEAVIKAADDYVKPETVSITIGGNKLAEEEYSYTFKDGRLIIPKEKIIGDVSINAKGRSGIMPKTDKTTHIYDGGAKNIIVSATDVGLDNDDFAVKYYKISENYNRLEATIPVVNAVEVGKYLYVISFIDEGIPYGFAKPYRVTDDTALPVISDYDNIGYMTISATAEQQKPISFAEGKVSMLTGETYENTLHNPNQSTVTYSSSNPRIASVDKTTGKITAIKPGAVTITAESTKKGTATIYASYDITIRKQLTINDFDVTATPKDYDGTTTANAAAKIKAESLDEASDIVAVSVSAEYDNADAGEAKTVNCEITGISGKNADKYVLADEVKAAIKCDISKAKVSVICAATTTCTFDGEAQTVDVSAMANGKVFDSSNYTVKYNGADEAKAVGEYPISIVLSEEADKNYEVVPFTAVLKIVNATQEVFSIEGVPETVQYGDHFVVSAYGADGNISYEITEGGDIASIDENSGAVTIKGIGRVTITATSQKDGHNDRTAKKTFEAKKRVLTPSAVAAPKNYDGTNEVAVIISLENIANDDVIFAEAVIGAMINPDAGNDKIVYVSGIELGGAKADLYTLSTQNLQTTVNIYKKEITGFSIKAENKKYDDTVNAQAVVENIEGVLEADKGQVEIVGKTEFDDKNSDNDKTVTFTATGLTGAKAANYTLTATTAATTADIEPLRVDFVIGGTSFVYDGKDKEITVSANDENGRIFKDYEVVYNETPNEAGEYSATIKLGDTTNYYTEQGDIKITITEATQDQLVIVGLPGTIQYGDSFELEAIGGADGGSYEWISSNENVTIKNADSANPTVTIDGAVGEKVEITVTKSTDNYKPVSAKIAFKPTEKVVTFDISNLEQTYGEVSKIEVKPSDEAAAYDVTYNGSEELPEDAGTYTVKVAANGNYSGTQTATLVIDKAQATGEITGILDNYTYGDNISAEATNLTDGTTAQITYAGTGIYVPQTEAPKNYGSYTAIVTITGKNYETLMLTKNFKIEKAELTVKAKDTTRAYGEANPIFELEYTGFVNGDTEAVILSEPIARTAANASSPADTYDITVSGGSAENYKFKYDNTGKLTVTGATGGNLIITGATNTVYVNDIFTLHAFYGNSKVDVAWESSDSNIAEISADGQVTVKKAGSVTIKATAGANYGNAAAEFTLTAKQSGITLVPANLVKKYNGQRQDISFEPNADFTPVLDGTGKNVTVKYTLISDPTVTEPIQAGIYSVVYTITDGSYTGGGNTTMYINKSEVKVKPSDITKMYGEDAPAYGLEFVNAEDAKFASLEEIKELVTFASDGAVKTAAVTAEGYDITATLKQAETDNLILSVEGTGKLTVTKAPLTVTVKNVSHEYGAENPQLEALYTGFKNDETAEVLTGELQLTYDESINAETAVGTYTGVTKAAGLTSDNYEISYANGDVTVTKIAVKASAGTARSSYLTVNLDKPIAGLTAENFVVKNGDETITLTEVTPSSDNKTYTLKGSFSTSVTYTIETNLTGTESEATHEITSEALTVKPSTSGGSGGGGGGGSSAPTTYTVTFETNGGSKTGSVKVTKNDTLKKPTEPTKDGYTFDGWFTDKELTKAYDFTGKVTKAFTLYAKWNEDKYEPTDQTKPSEWKNPFTDVKTDDWFYDSVKSATENGLFSGTTDTTFAPNEAITRGMIVTVLWRMEEKPIVNYLMTFTDIENEAYYTEAVRWAASEKIVLGYSDEVFAPDKKITREEMAAILHRYADYKGIDTSARGDLTKFTDEAQIADWARENVSWAAGSGLLTGKGNNILDPNGNTTRAETAAMLVRLQNTIK